MPKLRDEVDANQIYTRGFIDGVEVRAIDEEKRTAEFVAATEGGVDTWGGKEYLRMSGAKLSRYRKNPVVLDTHNRWSSGSVIGKAEVKVEGKRLIAAVTFATTPSAEEVWQLVKGGFIRALSVGFMPYANTVKRLAEGEFDGEGEDKVTGPGRVIRSWELYEISVVPVPADPDCLRRSLDSITPESLAAIINAALNPTRPQGAERSLPVDTKDTQEAALENKGAENKPDEGIAPEARDLQIKRERALLIRSIAPKGMEKIAEEMILKDVSEADARKRFFEELEKKTPPVGTPEPEKPAKEENKRSIGDIADRDLAESILG